MATFAYNAINALGHELEGTVSASDAAAAIEQLRLRGLHADRLSEVSGSAGNTRVSVGMFRSIKPKSLQIFSRQFATMIEAGMNVVAALAILEQQTTDSVLAEVIGAIREDVENGMLLSEAMALHPKVFSRIYVAMVEAGEAAGILDIVLDRVALQIEKEQTLKRRVKSAMVYPTITMTFAIIVLNVMLLFVVPIFIQIFNTLNGKLPTLTQYVLTLSNLMRGYWYIIFPAVGLTAFGLLRGRKTGRGRDLGHDPAAHPVQDRGRGAQDHPGAVRAHALDARRGRGRHPQGARDHGAGLRQLRVRAGARRGAGQCARRLDDRPAVARQRHLPADGQPDGAHRRGDR